ncbi:hypothetical protein BD414DRAFT_496486 [Trametes punicea]|nr:hypothetical protein BD414DRAFT_496486 [Trametes punicea]
MSSESVTTAEAIIANHAFFFIEDCALFAEASLIFYEYLITFDSEVRLVWRRKLTGASIVFFFNRYLMILQNVITIVSYPAVSDLFVIISCVALGWMDIMLNLLPYFIWNAFSTLRVYALCGHSWRFAWLVCLLMVGPIAANLYNIPLQKPDNMPPPYNCEVDNAVTLAVHTKLSLIAGDSIVLAVTWWKTYRLKKAAEVAQVRASIVDLLLRDGRRRDARYLAGRTMLVLNVLHIIINFVEKVSFMGDIADVLTSILVSRFIMNLRDLDGNNAGQGSRSDPHGGDLETWLAAQSGAGTSSARRQATLVFASAGEFIDSMGGPLEHSTSAASVEEDGLYSSKDDVLDLGSSEVAELDRQNGTGAGT